jgi:hypothetical protein
MNLESQGKGIATEIITSQLETLQDAGLRSKKSLFLIVICPRESQPAHDFALRLFEDLWHSFKIIEVKLVIPYFNRANPYTSALPSVQVTRTELFEPWKYVVGIVAFLSKSASIDQRASDDF